MDNDVELDIGEVMRVIGGADVLLLRFVIVPQRLLLDARSSDVDGPLLKLVPRVNSARERFRELKQLRPRFALPDRITAIPWPRLVDTPVPSGVWAAIEQRLAAPGPSPSAPQAIAVLAEPKQRERLEVQHAVRGEGYQALWERKC